MRNRLYLNRWLSFVASCLLQASAGLSYSFSIFAPALKEIWGYHETQIATVGSCFNIGGYLAIPSGALYDRLEKHKRFGPRFVALFGALTLAAGYLGLYAAATGIIAPSFPLVCLCAVLGGNSSTWFDTTAIVTNVRNFPRDRGTVVGILKAFVGLSASIYSSVYAAAFAPAAVRFLLFIGSVPPLLSLLLIAAINLVPEAYHEPQPQEQQQQQPSTAAATSAAAGGPASAVAAVPAGGAAGDSVTAPLLQHEHGHGHEPLPVPLQKPPPPQPAGNGAKPPKAARFSTQSRFAFTYCLVGMLAVYQTAAALWAGAMHPSQSARRALLGGLLSLLAVLLAVPLRSGDWVHRKPRPDAVERVRRSLLSRLAAKGAGAFARRSWRSSASSVTGVPPAAVPAASPAPATLGADGEGGGGGDGRLTEPLLSGMPTPQLGQTPLVKGTGEGGPGGACKPAAAPGVAVPAASSSVAAVEGLAKGAFTVRVVHGAAGGASDADELGIRTPAASEREDEAGPGALAGGLGTAVREQELEAQLEALEEVPALRDLPLSAAARTSMFWLLLIQFSVGLGTGLSFLNNLGSIVVALGGRPGGQVVFVSLFSVANATGRLLGGVVSELLLRRYGTPRTLVLLVVACLTLVGVGGMAASELSDLYATSLIAGLAFGAHWGLIPAITSDMFGLTHFGSNYTGLQLGPAAGGYLLATVLTGKLYERALRRHGGQQLFCIGAECYLETWCVLAVLNGLSILGTWRLYVQSVRRYRRLVGGGGV